MRLRAKLITVSVVLAGLLPIMWSSGAGSDVMKPLAAPIIGGMIASVHALIITPGVFSLVKKGLWKRGRLKASGMRH